MSSSPASAPESLGDVAARGVFWSVIQNWGGRFITFLLFVLLARFLSPTDYGIASAALLVLMFIGIVAEFGFGDAVVQNRNLHPEDINLPFYASIVVSSLLALGSALCAPLLEQSLHVKGLGVVLMALAAYAPLTTVSQFQEMNYRRNLSFRKLALRVLIANVIAGPIAVVFAYYGAGVWSLVVQSYVAVLVGLVWLWARPYWRPTLRLNIPASFALARFGASVVSMRVIDFAGTRLVDVLIVGKFGIAVYGLYSVGARLYQTLMQLLQTALNDVSLTVVSRIASDKARLAETYLRAIVLAAYAIAPVFVLSSALSTEICAILFGHKWDGVDAIAQPLLFLGAVQCVQFLNGPYLSANGTPHVSLLVNIVKYAILITGMLLIPAGDARHMVMLFVVLQLVAAPVSFIMTARQLGVSVLKIGGLCLPAAIAATAAFAAVTVLRPVIAPWSPHALVTGAVLAAAYCASYSGLVLLIGRKQTFQVVEFVGRRLGRSVG